MLKYIVRMFLGWLVWHKWFPNTELQAKMVLTQLLMKAYEPRDFKKQEP